MTYKMSCPHCKNAVRGGHGDPIKRIDSPIQTCPHCGKPYLDNNMYEWSVISTMYQLYFYFFANNRFVFPWLIVAIGLSTGSWILFGVLVLIWMACCVYWVDSGMKDKIEASNKRAADPDYVKLLAKLGYDKLADKYK